MIPKESIITPEIIKEREQRHRRLMKMIKNFKRSSEEISKLDRIKDNTVLEINFRYLRSQHNKNYVFPKNQDDSEKQENQVNPFTNKSNQLYDLHAQNEIIKKNDTLNNKVLESARRVKSLEREKNDIEGERLGRFEQTKGVYSYKKLRKKSAVDVKRILSTIKLPELNKKQKIEAKNDTMEFDKIVGKKLFTQTSSPKKSDVATIMIKQFQSKSRKKLQLNKKQE